MIFAFYSTTRNTYFCSFLNDLLFFFVHFLIFLSFFLFANKQIQLYKLCYYNRISITRV
ncbi:hypothetical protein HanPI659440_Chr12g0478101 [Helianthus annuus]|nr:hypothetical protein HanPI659440_Chr12g0478101 [Helianthus annuus]